MAFKPAIPSINITASKSNKHSNNPNCKRRYDVNITGGNLEKFNGNRWKCEYKPAPHLMLLLMGS